jgi:hypothetical protein
VADLGAAGRLAARAGELRDALARHGLSADAVQVSGGGPGAAPAAEPSAVLGTAPTSAAAFAGAAGGAAGGEAGGSSAGSHASSEQHARRDGSGAGGDALSRDARDPRDGRGGQRDGRRDRPHDGLLYDELAAPRRPR